MINTLASKVIESKIDKSNPESPNKNRVRITEPSPTKLNPRRAESLTPSQSSDSEIDD